MRRLKHFIAFWFRRLFGHRRFLIEIISPIRFLHWNHHLLFSPIIARGHIEKTHTLVALRDKLPCVFHRLCNNSFRRNTRLSRRWSILWIFWHLNIRSLKIFVGHSLSFYRNKLRLLRLFFFIWGATAAWIWRWGRWLRASGTNLDTNPYFSFFHSLLESSLIG